MDKMSMQLVRNHIDRILSYLSPSLHFINCHMVEFFSAGLWDKLVPKEIQREILNGKDAGDAARYFFNSEYENKYPNLHNSFLASKELHLENLEGILLSPDQLYDSLEMQLKTIDDACNVKEFMNEKKNHEVDIFARVVATLTTSMNQFAQCETYVLDAGDGKGYLSSRLALQYNMKVLGIDASNTNTEGSRKRMKKLQRAWQGLENRTRLKNSGVASPRRSNKPKMQYQFQVKSTSSQMYKSVNYYITSATDFDLLLKQNFDIEKDFSVCLCGLHTCGNLAANCLEIFVKNSRMQLLCNVGCCYHLMSEMFIDDEQAGSWGFPLSNYLRNKGIKIGRNARMLASQSIHKTRMQSELNTKSLYYRALLEVILTNRFPNHVGAVRVGKIKNFDDFKSYLMRCEEKCCLGLDKLDSSYIDGIAAKYAELENFMRLFYLIRMSYAQIIESLILLDRLLYVKESQIERSWLVRLFDPVISPRCFALIAVR